MRNSLYNDYATDDYPMIRDYFYKKGIKIEIDARHPTGEDCIFDVNTKEWLGYVSHFCFEHIQMECTECLSCENGQHTQTPL